MASWVSHARPANAANARGATETAPGLCGHLTAVAHLRQLERVSGQKMLPDGGDAGVAAESKQLARIEAA